MPEEFTVKFNRPDVWLMRHYDTYTAGCRAYAKAHEEGSELHAAFAGSLALIDAGYVTVEAPDTFKAYLNGGDQDNVPLPVIGLVVREVARKVEAATAAPLGQKAVS